jgi:hypothetical protein
MGWDGGGGYGGYGGYGGGGDYGGDYGGYGGGYYYTVLATNCMKPSPNDGNNGNYPWHPDWDKVSGCDTPGNYADWHTKQGGFYFSQDNGKSWVYEPGSSHGWDAWSAANQNGNPSTYIFKPGPTS